MSPRLSSRSAGIGRDEGMRRSFAFLTSDNFFTLMGVKPALGPLLQRGGMPTECRTCRWWWRVTPIGNEWAAARILSAALCRSTAQPYTVIGVTPNGFSGVSALIAPDIWLPFGLYSHLGSAFADTDRLHDLAQPKNYTLNITARMRPGLTIDRRNRGCRFWPTSQRAFSRLIPKAHANCKSRSHRVSASAPHRKMMARSRSSALC